jgi:hypothetical protein
LKLYQDITERVDRVGKVKTDYETEEEKNEWNGGKHETETRSYSST